MRLGLAELQNDYADARGAADVLEAQMSTSPKSMPVSTSGPLDAGPPTGSATAPVDPRSWSNPARAAAALVLVASSLLVAASALVAPSYDERAERLAHVAADPAPFELSSALQIAALPFSAAGVVLVSLLSFAGSRRLSVIGGVLGLVGVVGGAVVAGIELMTDAVAAGGLDLTKLAAVDANLMSPPVIVAAVLFIPVSVLGYIVRGVALWRARAVPAVVVVLYALWLPVDFVGVPYVAPALGVLVKTALAIVVMTRSEGRASTSTGHGG